MWLCVKKILNKINVYKSWKIKVYTKVKMVFGFQV